MVKDGRVVSDCCDESLRSVVEIFYRIFYRPIKNLFSVRRKKCIGVTLPEAFGKDD